MHYFIRFLTLLAVIGTNEANAQKEQNIWYFGDGSGIDFNTTPPTALTNGAIFTFDNSSAVSDTSGQILFYTNGVTVWNKLHQVMTNGTGLSGNNSGGQSALIVPRPGTTLYYIFVVGNHGLGDLTYSVVDMSLSSGLGTVTVKNQLLHSSTTEKLAVFFDCSNQRYKIISHQYNSNLFYVYEVDANGLNATPVISAVGNVHFGGSIFSSHDAMGQLTLAPNGTLLACAQQYNNTVQLFDFNPVTGVITNPRDISLFSPWGLAFSPNSSFLYLTQWLTNEVYQVDLSNPSLPGNPISIGSVSGTSPGYGAGYLELAPDNKIYIAKWQATHLSVINQPNLPGGQCAFADNGISLAGKTSTAGVCRTIRTTLPDPEINYSQSCQTISFTLNDTLRIDSISWDFGDGNGSAIISPTHIYQQGQYNVSVLVHRCGDTDTLLTTVSISNATNATISTSDTCNFAAAFSITGSNLINCEWTTGDSTILQGFNVTHVYDSAGSYLITALITDSAGCTALITDSIFIQPTPSAGFISELDTCTGIIQLTNSSSDYSSLTWIMSNGIQSDSINPVFNIGQSGTYTITLIAAFDNCFDTSSAQFTIPGFVDSEFSFNDSPCDTLYSFTNLSQNATGYLWTSSDGQQSTSTEPEFLFEQSANYEITLIAFNGSCSDTSKKNIVIYPLNEYKILYTLDTCNRKIQLFTDPASDSIEWVINGLLVSDNPQYQLDLDSLTTATITAIILDSLQCKDSSQLILDSGNFNIERDKELPNVFSPNDDKINDTFHLKEYFRCDALKVMIYNRWGKKVFETSDPDQTWDGKNATEGTYMIIVKRSSGNETYTLTLVR